jgi:hypothetical protein
MGKLVCDDTTFSAARNKRQKDPLSFAKESCNRYRDKERDATASSVFRGTIQFQQESFRQTPKQKEAEEE